jgi:hypothetical protein
MLPAALGGDDGIERSYFNDMLLENYYYYLAWESFIDGSSTNFRSNFTAPMTTMFDDTFIQSYGFQVSYQAYAMLRDPWAAHMMPHYVQIHLAMCSDTVPNSLPSYWCATYQYSPNIADPGRLVSATNTPNVGQYFAADASEIGELPTGFIFTAGSGAVTASQDISYWKAANGDKLKAVHTSTGSPYDGPDELRTDTWYTVTNVSSFPSGGVKAFEILNPATGVPFVAFTKNGAPFSTGYTFLKMRNLSYGTDVSSGWASNGYAPYAQVIMYGLRDLGFSAIDPAIAKMLLRGFVDPGPTTTKSNWDPNVMVP